MPGIQPHFPTSRPSPPPSLGPLQAEHGVSVWLSFPGPLLLCPDSDQTVRTTSPLSRQQSVPLPGLRSTSWNVPKPLPGVRRESGENSLTTSPFHYQQHSKEPRCGWPVVKLTLTPLPPLPSSPCYPPHYQEIDQSASWNPPRPLPPAQIISMLPGPLPAEPRQWG